MERYRGRISGPLLDRIDLHVEVPSLTYEEITSAPVAVGRERTPQVNARQGGPHGRRHVTRRDLGGGLQRPRDEVALEQVADIAAAATVTTNPMSEKRQSSVRS